MNNKPVLNRLQRNYEFMIAESSLLVKMFREHELTTAIMRTNKIPLANSDIEPVTTVYNTHKMTYHPPNANQHHTHKVVV